MLNVSIIYPSGSKFMFDKRIIRDSENIIFLLNTTSSQLNYIINRVKTLAFMRGSLDVLFDDGI